MAQYKGVMIKKEFPAVICPVCEKKVNIFLRGVTNGNGHFCGNDTGWCKDCFLYQYENFQRKPIVRNKWELQKLQKFQDQPLIKIYEQFPDENFENRNLVLKVVGEDYFKKGD